MASEIRRLEQAQVDALLRNDLAALQQRWTDEFTVNNPFGRVVKGKQGPVAGGALTYESFTREVETVVVAGDTAVAMGNETVVPSGSSPDVGQTIHRRFTDVWQDRGGTWMLIARHASVICERGVPGTKNPSP